MKVLIVTDVTNASRCSSIHPYVAACTDDELWDVETAFEEMDIAVTEDDVESISAEIAKNGAAMYRNLRFEVKLVIG